MGKGVGIHAAYKEFGRANFTKEIIEEVEDNTPKRIIVSEREKYWIQELNTMEPNGYNRYPGGIGGCTKEAGMKGAATRKSNGFHLSEETKRKISQSHKGKKFTTIHRQHLSEHHHSKKTWTLVHEDGTETQYVGNMRNFVKSLGVSYNKFIRASYHHKFINGVYIKGIRKEDYATLRNDSPKELLLCQDPIQRDICSLKNLRQRKHRHPDLYKDITPNYQIIDGDIL